MVALRITRSHLPDMVHSPGLFFDAKSELRTFGFGLENDVAFGLGGTGNVAGTARIIQENFQHLSTLHLLEANFGMRPVEGTFHTGEVEENGGLARTHHLS